MLRNYKYDDSTNFTLGLLSMVKLFQTTFLSHHKFYRLVEYSLNKISLFFNPSLCLGISAQISIHLVLFLFWAITHWIVLIDLDEILLHGLALPGFQVFWLDSWCGSTLEPFCLVFPYFNIIWSKRYKIWSMHICNEV